MRSQRQSEASRINGAKSRGPKTPLGRATSSRNALKHGLTAKTLSLANQNTDLLLEVMNSYFDFFKPANQVEIDIVRDIASARWRLHRVWRYQKAMLDLEMDTQAPAFEKRYETVDEDRRGAAAFSAIVDNSKGYITALRTDVHLTRSYRRAIHDLRCLRAGNLLRKNKIFQNEPEPPDVNPLNTIKTASKISTEPEDPKP